MSRECVYDFPDDHGLSVANVLATFGHGAVSLPLGERLLGFSATTAAIMFRLAFGHIAALTENIFGVLDADYAACRQWLTANVHHIGSAWRHLEVLSFDSATDQARFEAAYDRVLGHPAEAIDPAHWPHVFGR